MKAMFIVLLISTNLWASISDSKALTMARDLWGTNAVIRRFRTWGDNDWSMAVGFESPGCKEDPTILGTGFATWDAAFAAVPPGTANAGTYSGTTSIQVASPGVEPSVISEPVSGLITAVQLKLDGTRLGPAMPTISVPWSVSYAWDTTTVADGFHVLCAELQHADSSTTLIHAVMIIVKQGL